jgi:hypothetical protein
MVKRNVQKTELLFLNFFIELRLSRRVIIIKVMPVIWVKRTQSVDLTTGCHSKYEEQGNKRCPTKGTD